jgi:hypothetical protein
MILFPLIPIFIAGQAILPIAIEIPYFDVTSTCRAETATIPANLEFCIQDEQRAHDRLIQEWAQFSPSDQSDCVRAADSRESSGYVELADCLELKRDSKRLSKH